MSLILAIETATKVCSVALFKEDELIALREQNGNYSHAENLAVFVKECFQEVHYDYKDLSTISVSKGPGSYTGLRIGVAFAKGLCFSLNKPLIAIDTLTCMAWGVSKEHAEDSYFCPMIDARRMEVYSSVFDNQLKMVRPIGADIVEEEVYASFLEKRKTYFFGDGSAKCRPIIQHENAIFLDQGLPSARNMGLLSLSKLQAGDFEDVAYFEPFYLKEFIALKGKKLV